MPVHTHGTNGGYVRGCRCDDCKRAHAEAARKRIADNPQAHYAYRRRKYAENPEKVAEQNKRWREANPDKVKENKRQYRERHRERQKEYARVYYLLHREKFIAKAKRWKQENPERDRELSRARYWKDPEASRRKNAEYQRQARERDPEKFQERFRRWATSEAGRVWFKETRRKRAEVPYTEAALEWLESLVEPLCTYCGQPASTIDHIVPISAGGDSDRENLTPACLDCNRRKSAMSVSVFLKRLEDQNRA